MMERQELIELHPLAAFPEYVGHLATWFFDEWGHRRQDASVEEIADTIRSRMHIDQLPIIYVALQRSKLVGTASLVTYELKLDDDYKHWLASVYVAEGLRGRGRGSTIVQLAAQKAIQFDIAALYLYTHSHEAFYARNGWRPVKRVPHRGREVVVMIRRLN
jgi:N-acetylglutamate synthase-like GNAT family acetyltransferase